MRPVEDGHITEGYALIMKSAGLGNDPGCLFGSIRGGIVEHGAPVRQHRDQILFDPLFILIDQRVCGSKDLGRGAVVFKHHNGLRPGKLPVEVQKVAHVGAAPGIDRLVRVAHDKKVVMVAAERLHELVLQPVDVLKLIDHDVGKALLPFLPDVRILPEDIEAELDEVVIVEAEALLLLVEVAVENDLVGGDGI